MDTSPAKDQPFASGNNSLGLLSVYGSSDSDSDSEIIDDKRLTQSDVTIENGPEITSPIKLQAKFTTESSMSTDKVLTSDSEDTEADSDTDCEMQTKATSTIKAPAADNTAEPSSPMATVVSSDSGDTSSEANSDCEIQSETKSKENEPNVVLPTTNNFTNGPYREISSDDGER